MISCKRNLKWAEAPLVWNRAVVRSASEFGIRRHTASMIPYCHSHDFFEMIYVYEGSCRQYINEEKNEVVLQKGEACLITPGTAHAILSSGRDNMILKMVIPADMFRAFWRDTFEKRDELVLRMERPDEFCLFPLSHGRDGSIRWLFTKLLEECYSRDHYRQASMKGYLSLLFVTLLRSQADSPEPGLCCRVSEQISNRLQQAQLKDIAGQMGYSARHLERLLREEAGCTFSGLLQRLRMEKAAQLLTETDDTIELITEKTGYQTGAAEAERCPACCRIRTGFCPPGK